MSYATALLSWQNFYFMVGGASATLVGLMFVAVTFGSSLVTEETLPTTRAFLDPSFTHFVQVLLIACLLLIPTMTPTLLGAALLTLAGLRLIALLRVYQHMKAAHQQHNDLELSDWLSGVVFPMLCHLLLAGAGVAFILGSAIAFNVLAFVIVAILMIGVFGAWELMVWMAMARSRKK